MQPNKASVRSVGIMRYLGAFSSNASCFIVLTSVSCDRSCKSIKLYVMQFIYHLRPILWIGKHPQILEARAPCVPRPTSPRSQAPCFGIGHRSCACASQEPKILDPYPNRGRFVGRVRRHDGNGRFLPGYKTRARGAR